MKGGPRHTALTPPTKFASGAAQMPVSPESPAASESGASVGSMASLRDSDRLTLEKKRANTIVRLSMNTTVPSPRGSSMQLHGIVHEPDGSTSDLRVKVIEGEQHYKKTGKSGVGLFFLEEDSLFIVRNIVEGGSAWRDGTIKMSDICVAVDGISMEDRGLQDLRNAVIGAEGTMVTLTFHRIVDQSRTVFKVVLRRGQGLVEENARLSLELSSALQVISSLEQGGRDALADDAQMQMLRQQLDAQSEELLYCRRQRTINEAQNVLTSQTIQNLEDKVLLSNTQYAQLLETHQALELRFELDSQQHLKQQQQLLEELQSVRQSTAQQIDSVQQAAALQLERCSQDARASSLQLQSKLQDQKKHDELQQQLQQQLAESNSQLKAMSLKLVQMGDQVRRFEAQVASQSASIESERQSTAQLLSHMQVQEKSLGEARAMLSSLSTDNARLDAELHLSREALDASHIRERELIVRSETSCNDAIAEAASRARVAAEQHRLSQGQIEALQKQLIDAQFQQQDARRLADAAAGAEREASSRASIADAEILQLRRRVIELVDAAASATSSSETASTRAVRLERQVLELQRQMAEVERELQSARAESGEWMRSSREAEDRMRAIQKEADSSRKQLLDLVRLCRQQERAHAALKESLQQDMTWQSMLSSTSSPLPSQVSSPAGMLL